MLCWLVSWSSVIGGGKCLWNLRFIWCHSQVFQSSASWWFQLTYRGAENSREHISGWKVPQGWLSGTQSKHLTHMHTPALRVFGSDENWQWFECNDYVYVCDLQPSSQTSSIHHWKHEPKDLSQSQSKYFLFSKSRHKGQCTVTNQKAKFPKHCICKMPELHGKTINDSS